MKSTWYTVRALVAVSTMAAAAGAQAGPQSGAAAAGAPRPPIAAKEPHLTQIHGYTRSDDYFWLRRKSDPAVLAYLNAENAYTTAVMKPTEAVQRTLYDEMLGRIQQTDVSAPYRKGDYLYYSRTEAGKQYAVMARRRVGSDAEQVTLDLNEMAKGRAYFSLNAYEVSDDGNLLAYSVDTTGYRQYALRVKDLRTGATLPDLVARATSVVWAADNRTLFVTTEDSITKRSDRFWRHPVGTDSAVLLYDERDELYDVSAARSSDRKAVLLQSAAKTSDEWRWIPADRPTAPPTVIIPRTPGHEYAVDHDTDRFYLRTNQGAKNRRLVWAPESTPDSTHWTTVVAHDPKVKLEDVQLFAGHIVLSERENGLTYLRVIDKRSGASHRVATPEPVYTLALGNNPEYGARSVQINYASMVTPASTYDYDLSTRKRTLLKQQPVLGYDASKYVSQRVWATARDGTKVPVALVYRRGTKLDGSAPMLLYAYGSYGVSIDPTFSSARLSLLDRGVIYALASIRGGGELGEEWREQGRMMQKMNTFTDFVDVADFLEKQHYTSADRLAIEGGSAGGLLIGAVVNMRPDLFKAAVAQVPFVDVMNTMLDATLPLTTSEYIEWGNPNEKAAYDYMIRYSPYDNVRRQAYPAMLIETSLNDSQVPYWEGAKFAARLREMKTDDHVLLLRTNMGAGHGGASGRYDRLKEAAFEYAFMLQQLGVPDRVMQ